MTQHVWNHTTAGTRGLFTNPGSWTPSGVPGSADYAVLPAGSDPNDPYVCVESSRNTVGAISIGAAAELEIETTSTIVPAFTILNGGANAGLVLLDENGSNAPSLTFGGMLNNSGTIVGGSNYERYHELPYRYNIISSDGTLMGGGVVKYANLMGYSVESTLENSDNTIKQSTLEGLNVTNEANGVLIDDLSFNSDLTNYGIVETAHLYNSYIVNLGTIFAPSGPAGDVLGSTINQTGGGSIGLNMAFNGATLLAGTIGVGSGSSNLVTKHFLSYAGTYGSYGYISLFDGLAGAIDNVGNLSVLNGVTLDIEGAISNSSTISLGSTGASTRLLVTPQSASLTGSGSVVLSNNPNNKILGTLTGKTGAWAVPTLTNFNTISGAGRIGLDLSLVNAGAIDATGPAATKTTHTGNLVLETGYSGAKGSNTIVNSGVIEATNPSNFTATGGLVLRDVTVNDGATGEVAALGAHTMVQVEASTITGGSLVTSGGGQILVIGAGSALSGAAHTVMLSGALAVKDGGGLAISGTVKNTGTISLLASGTTATLTANVGATLTGGGQLILADNPGNLIAEGPPGSKGAAASLTNVDNTIAGAGTITADLINQAKGLVEATGSNALVLDSGATAIVNNGTLEAAGAGGLTLASAVSGAGSAVIQNGTLNAEAAFSQNVAFTGASGTLELAHSQAYAGTVSGFSTSGGTSFDLADIAFGGSTTATYSGTTASGVLSVTDGTHTAKIAMSGDYTASTFTVSSDGHGGTTVVDPPAASSAGAFSQAMAAFGVRPGGAGVAHTAAPMRRTPLLARISSA